MATLPKTCKSWGFLAWFGAAPFRVTLCGGAPGSILRRTCCSEAGCGLRRNPSAADTCCPVPNQAGFLLFALGIFSPLLALAVVAVFGRLGAHEHVNPWVIVPLVVGFVLVPTPSFGLGTILSIAGISKKKPGLGSRLSLILNACGLSAVAILYAMGT